VLDSLQFLLYGH